MIISLIHYVAKKGGCKDFLTPCTENAVQVMQYMANFFADQARPNTNHFDSLADEVKYLLYQYTPDFMNLQGSHFQQIYFFS